MYTSINNNTMNGVATIMYSEVGAEEAEYA